MGKRFIRSGALILALLVALPIAAWADSIEGRVVSATPQNLEVTVYDAQGRPYPNALNLAVDGGTQVNGISNVSDLRPNDPVGVQVHQTEAGAWHADSVTRYQDINAQPATKQTPSALQGFLGNPAARGALLGAATGAIAAGASHGKVGKGALIGAGVGGLAGLLFNNNSKRSSDSDSNQ